MSNPFVGGISRTQPKLRWTAEEIAAEWRQPVKIIEDLGAEGRIHFTLDDDGVLRADYVTQVQSGAARHAVRIRQLKREANTPAADLTDEREPGGRYTALSEIVRELSSRPNFLPIGYNALKAGLTGAGVRILNKGTENECVTNGDLRNYYHGLQHDGSGHRELQRLQREMNEQDRADSAATAREKAAIEAEIADLKRRAAIAQGKVVENG